jgi:hypothetical protein
MPGERVGEIGEVLPDDAFAVVDPERDLQGFEGLPADPALEAGHHGDGRVAGHEPGQGEIDGEAGPQGRHKKTQAA